MSRSLPPAFFHSLDDHRDNQAAYVNLCKNLNRLDADLRCITSHIGERDAINHKVLENIESRLQMLSNMTTHFKEQIEAMESAFHKAERTKDAIDTPHMLENDSAITKEDVEDKIANLQFKSKEARHRWQYYESCAMALEYTAVQRGWRDVKHAGVDSTQNKE